ncbi:MAG TPA: HD-GYP domain-containing protein [Pyrinomonadaceae bacterium]
MKSSFHLDEAQPARLLHAQAAALIIALHAKSEETAAHAERVARYSLRLGRELKLSPVLMRDLKYGALLHDIGKIAVTDNVLCKPGRLTEEEWEKMRVHVWRGANMLRALGFPEGACLIPDQHHEMWDGSGYPSGLRELQITIEARIVQVADAFDAITCDRCYRKGEPYAVAAHEIREGSETQFDPLIVEAFLSVPREEWI